MKIAAIFAIFVLAFSVAAAGCTGGQNGQDDEDNQDQPDNGTDEQDGQDGGQEAVMDNLKINSGGTGGVYFPLSSRLAKVLNDDAKTMKGASAVTSGASVANEKAIRNGDTQAAMIQNDIAAYGYQGKYMFEEPDEHIRGVAALYPETIQFVVRADSDINTIKDLDGKKVAIGAPGSGTAVAAEQVLKAANVWEDVTPVRQDFSKAAQSLRLGQVDLAILVGGLPTPAVSEVATQKPVRLMEIPDSTLNTLQESGYPYYVRVNAPADTYKGMEEKTKTIAVKAILVARDSVPDAAIKEMVSLLYKDENLKTLRAVHKKAENIALDTALNGMSIPLHPGAAQYYKEQGMSIPEEMQPPEG